ncbi:hypothetical protein RvVAR031_pl05290 (plasmid) [Agrobacterium vitis]|nr:hypothetical protein RvVAR031_pl05290 [Agrobacterium vitis]
MDIPGIVDANLWPLNVWFFGLEPDERPVILSGFCIQIEMTDLILIGVKARLSIGRSLSKITMVYRAHRVEFTFSAILDILA